MTALLNAQKRLSKDEESAVRMAALAEKAHELLVKMEDVSGVSEELSSMRLSGVEDGGQVRMPSLKPTTVHYDCVIEAIALATTMAREAGYTCNFTMNAPYIAQRWLSRMETLSSNNPGVAPTLQSYSHVMEACSFISAINKQSKGPILTQSIFDKLKHNPNLNPTAKEYRLLLRTWSESNCKDSAYKATGVWMAMHGAFKRGEEGMEPTLEDGKMVLESWSRAV
jgi:hypothetical protein